MRVAERIEHVERFLVATRARRTPVVNLLMWEIGKTRADSEKEFDRTVDLIVETIRALKELDRTASRFVQDQGIMAQIRRAPVGVALCMGLYNHPLNETFSTLFPALLMGNAVVFKPARFGVLLIRPLLEAFRDCFPPGVINIIYGRGRETVGALMESGLVDLFAFIGTNRGASELKRMHPQPHRLKSVLGLDAKNPAIILEDADLENTVKECITGTLSFNGQRCTALTWSTTPCPRAPGWSTRSGGRSAHSYYSPAVVYPVLHPHARGGEDDRREHHPRAVHPHAPRVGFPHHRLPLLTAAGGVSCARSRRAGASWG